jgi:hypothetical protein
MDKNKLTQNKIWTPAKLLKAQKRFIKELRIGKFDKFFSLAPEKIKEIVSDSWHKQGE